MAPKKDKKGKDKEPAQPEFSTLYVQREPVPLPEPPDVSEADVAWKALRNQYALPLPDWNSDAVNEIEWKPNEVDSPFTSDQFSVKSLPKSFMQVVSGWRRAGVAALSKGDPGPPEEPEPQAQPLPELAAPEPELDPKDAKAKAKAKADAKAKSKPGKNAVEESPDTKPTTMQQYAECTYSGEARVVSQAEFRSRELMLDLDAAAPQLSQSIAAQFAAVAEHKWLLPKGNFLWELIYPQDEEGIPLFNPHGKYLVKLFVQGRWRQVPVDDVVPVGHAMHGTNVHAPVLPASQNPSVIWPQLLAKGLLRAFQDDLGMQLLPAVTALTGWIPFQLPLSWGALQSLHNVRTFCTLQHHSQVDLEARQRAELLPPSAQIEDPRQDPRQDPRTAVRKPGAPPVPSAPAVPALNLPGGSVSQPKLGVQPNEAIVEFLVCELEEEPRQVRLKAAELCPPNGTPRKLARDAESEEEDGSAEEGTGGDASGAQGGYIEEADDSDREEPDEDDEERPSQNEPVADDAENSARSKGSGDAAEGEQGQQEEAEEDTTPWTAPWPENMPAPLTMKSMMLDFHGQLAGGYWVGFEEVQLATSTICSYIPAGDHLVSTSLDTSWAAARTEAFSPPRCKLLRIALVEKDQETRHLPKHKARPAHGQETGETKSFGPVWHNTVLCYEPVRATANFSAFESSATPSFSSSCLLQAVNSWQIPPKRKAKEQIVGVPPESIHMSVGDGPSASGIVWQSLLLPQGVHWYLVLDDAASLAGSVLSMHVEGSHLDGARSSIEFMDPAQAMQEHGITVLSVGPMEYPIHQGFRVWAKAEVVLSPEVLASGAQSLQLVSHVSDASLWPYLQLSCLLMEQADADGVDKCASWSVSPMMKSPLVRVMSVPLSSFSGAVDLKAYAAGTRSMRLILLLEADLPHEVKAKSGGTFSLELFIPPTSSSSGTPARRTSTSSQGKGAEETVAVTTPPADADDGSPE
ncbi:unnamed protein product, partial [Polarella glacialis]